MKKYLLILTLIICLLAGFGGGAYITDRVWDSQMAPVVARCTVVNFQTCLFMVDSDMMRFIAQSNSRKLKKLRWRMERCSEFLDQAGKTATDEKTSRFLGEIRLFYDGYAETLNEIIATQVKLELLYNGFLLKDMDKNPGKEILKLSEEQAEHLIETRKFLQRLEALIAETWK
jgi:hypothetical protein